MDRAPPQPNEQGSEPDRLGGGRGRVNPPPRRLVWRFWEVWRVWCWFGGSTRLEARGLGGFGCTGLRVTAFGKRKASEPKTFRDFQKMNPAVFR